jgi:hypothetical protein
VELRREEIGARSNAIAIRRIVPNDRESLDYLIQLLHSTDPNAHQDAVMALSDLGKLALPALPALEAYPYEDTHGAVWTIKNDAGL